MSLQCVHVKFSGLEFCTLKHDRRNGCSCEEHVHASNVGVCCLLWNTVKLHVSGTGTNLWMFVVYHSTTHF
jgi:hypothetical protein